MTLPIKPEDLTRSEPSRVSVVNTIGGAWVDSFGRGLSTLTISGNTGWRPKGGQDGIAQFVMLRDSFIHRWHSLRQDRIDQGLDPDEVRLIFIDPLNGDYVADVAPMSFTLRRSRSQPLLLTYNITMTVVQESADNPYPELMEAIDPASKVSTSVASLTGSVAKITGGTGGGGLIGTLNGIAANIGTLGASALAATKSAFGPVMDAAAKIIATANAAKRVLTAAEEATVGVARELAATAQKVWDAAGAVAGIPTAAKAAIMQIKGEFSNLSCVLSNGFTNAITAATTPPLPYGASNCSSTAGGSPPSNGSNPFAGATTAGPIGTTPDAVAAINAINAMDPLKPISDTQLQALIARVNAGVTVAGVAPAVVSAPAPTVTAISPNSSSRSARTTVTITGINLSGVTSVKINGLTCSALSASTPTSITCVTPLSGVVGSTSVVVTTPGGTNSPNTLFTFTQPAAVGTVTAPSIVSPSNNSLGLSGPVTVTSSAFAWTSSAGTADTHLNSDWELWTGPGRTGALVASSLADSVNKSSWSPVVSVGSTYHAVVRHRGATFGVSGYSESAAFSVLVSSTGTGAGTGSTGTGSTGTGTGTSGTGTGTVYNFGGSEIVTITTPQVIAGGPISYQITGGKANQKFFIGLGATTVTGWFLDASGGYSGVSGGLNYDIGASINRTVELTFYFEAGSNGTKQKVSFVSTPGITTTTTNKEIIKFSALSAVSGTAITISVSGADPNLGFNIKNELSKVEFPRTTDASGNFTMTTVIISTADQGLYPVTVPLTFTFSNLNTQTINFVSNPIVAPAPSEIITITPLQAQAGTSVTFSITGGQRYNNFLITNSSSMVLLDQSLNAAGEYTGSIVVVQSGAQGPTNTTVPLTFSFIGRSKQTISFVSTPVSPPA